MNGFIAGILCAAILQRWVLLNAPSVLNKRERGRFIASLTSRAHLSWVGDYMVSVQQ